MSYLVIGDSCTDLTKEQKAAGEIRLVPLTLDVNDEVFIDDETFSQEKFLAAMKESPVCPKSACPSPGAYMKHFDESDEIYVITLSARLSGSYNSAELAKEMYVEEHGEKDIFVIDSRSASVGQTLIAMKIQELKEAGKSFDEVCNEVLQYRNDLQTKFVLESLDNLRKNGRLTNLQAILANALNIKPVMKGTYEGEIDKVDQARGIKKALLRMVDLIVQDAEHPEDRILGISHCNNLERAHFVKEELAKRIQFKDTIIVDTAGVSSLYANDGGIIVCY
ncbi:MAG: DegV family protein [Lachnospiraceae bacterium]|nr:DegV family protein [Lachnospiraceae bacterium]